MKERVQKIFTKHEKGLGSNYFYRALTAIYLFDFLDKLKELNYPKEWLSILDDDLNELTFSFNSFDKRYDFSKNSFDTWDDSSSEGDFESKTGKVYYELWKNFKKDEFFDQTLNILKERFEKNSISVSGVGKALDDGCGSGRYSFALKELGCLNVTGIDVSPDSIALARNINPFKDEVSFTQGSVLELPFEDGDFDFVFSNGVLHHTKSTEKGLKEIYRVLKDDGFCWLYLYGGKESLFWDIVDYCRSLLSSVPQAYTQSLMRDMGYPPGRIFHRSDFFYVPVNNRYFKEEVERMVNEAGFKSSKRLVRGAAHDWDEIIHQNPDIESYIYGEGEMRYLINK
ncbi:class I SAM-dependent methyltransferase [Candidatus Omnitrophota bacterium]